MSAAPLPADESRRLALLHELGLLDTPAEEGFSALVETAAQSLGSPIAVLTLVDAERQWFKAGHGLALRETPRDIAFCSHAILGDALFEVTDARADPRFADNPLVTGAPGIRHYAGIALRVDQLALGTLAVLDTQPRRLDAAQCRLLQGLAALGTELLRSRRRLVALHAERVRLHDLARASGDWMWETDAALRYRWISGQFEPITGLPSEQLLGRPVDDSPLLDAQGQPLGAGEPGFLALLRRHEPFTRVITEKQTPRGRLLVSRSALPVVDDTGRFTGWRGTARDLTLQIGAQQLAAERDELLRKLSSQIPGVMFQFVRGADGRGSFPYISRGVEALFGLAPQALMHDPALALRLVHDDDRARAAADLQRSAATLTLLHAEYRVLGDGAALRWIEARAAPQRLADGGTLWHAFCADVTERKLSEIALHRGEERWEMAAQATGLGLAEVELASGTMRFDARARANHGLGEADGRPTLQAWLQSIHPDDREQARQAIERAIADRGSFQARYRVALPAGGERVLDIGGRVTLDAAGLPAGIIGTCRDATEQVLNDQLRSDKESAERASRAKSEFLSRVSHELRTPLHGILGFAQLMALDHDAPLAAAQQQRLDGVLQAGRHLLGLIDDMLDLTRIEHEAFVPRAEPVDAAAALRRCLALTAPLALARGVRLPEPPSAACWVHADPRGLEQVLTNLLSNAIKYNRDGGGVRVALRRQAERVTIAISDDGPGLDAAQQARLFQPFERLDAEARQVEGSGLGLVIARALAQAMGGQLELCSRPGAGSTFTLGVPASEAAGARPTAAAPTMPAATGAPRRVLYVEDEALNVLLMEELFRLRPQWTLQVAERGEQGLAAARAERPDLVVVDMNLPDMHGSELVRALRADPATAGLRCVALSADAMGEQIAAAREAGFDAYWTKPIDVPSLLAEMQRLLA